MKNLSHKDLLAVLAALEILHGEADPLNLPERTLGAVLSLILNEITSFDGFGTDSHYNGYLWYSPAGTVSKKLVRILGELVDAHPMFQDVIFKHVEKTAQISQYVTLAKFHQTALYNEFYKHIGSDSQMMTAFNVSPELYVTCSLHRLRSDFSERDLAVLEILAPHLLNTFRNAQFIHRADENGMIGNALERIGYEIITVDADLNVQNQNLAAIRMLHEYFSPSSFTNGLPEKLKGYIKHCATIFTGAEVYLSPAPLIIRKLDARLKIRLSFQSQTQTIVAFFEEIKDASPADLMQLGLTAREAEILFWMTKGKIDAEIAEIVKISVRTVHKHRENIFVKLGVETRTAATMRAIEKAAFY